jgi:hemolysin activation/secretion protein
MKRNKLILLLTLFIISVNTPLFAQVEKIEKIEREIEKEKLLREKIEEEKPKPEIEKPAPPKVAPPVSEQKILIKKIMVTGVTLLPEKELNDIILQFENKEVTLRDMQKAADLITDAYRRRGYITSRAYMPPQKIEEGRLEIRVIEGITGNIDVKGNRYFKTTLLRDKIVLKKGQPFNYEILRKGLSKINEQPDRNARAVIVPGKEPGTTDIVLEVKDRLPIHIGLDWDNFGSRYIEKDRYTIRLTHNNLLGLDDKLTFQYQLGEHDRYFLKSLRYLLPVGLDGEFGLFMTRSRVKLGQDLEDSDARGKSKLYGLFINKSLIDMENFDLGLNLGFDYKDTTNYQTQTVSNRDRMRVAKIGLDIDVTDNWGRSIISNELDFGIPNIMGGLTEQDPQASRTGAGGNFIKDNINFLRLQKMPFSTTLLWKNQIQLSPYILTATEQFQIGGISNVRGYPPAEVVGDKGYASTLEWSFPPYLVPRNFKVPFSKAMLYDAFRIALFYDWATARLKRPSATEEKNKTLRGVGWGFRFNLPEDFSVRLDFGWPLDNTPTDSDHMHPWIQVSKSF